MTTEALRGVMAKAIFDGWLEFLAEARIAIMATLLVVGAGISLYVLSKTKTLGPTMGAAITTILVVVLVAMMPGLADSASEQLGKNTGVGGDQVGDIFSRGNTP